MNRKIVAHYIALSEISILSSLRENVALLSNCFCFHRSLASKWITMQVNPSSTFLCRGLVRSSPLLFLALTRLIFIPRLYWAQGHRIQTGSHQRPLADTQPAAPRLEGIKRLTHWLDTPELRREGDTQPKQRGGSLWEARKPREKREKQASDGLSVNVSELVLWNGVGGRMRWTERECLKVLTLLFVAKGVNTLTGILVHQSVITKLLAAGYFWQFYTFSEKVYFWK